MVHICQKIHNHKVPTVKFEPPNVRMANRRQVAPTSRNIVSKFETNISRRNACRILCQGLFQTIQFPRTFVTSIKLPVPACKTRSGINHCIEICYFKLKHACQVKPVDGQKMAGKQFGDKNQPPRWVRQLVRLKEDTPKNNVAKIAIELRGRTFADIPFASYMSDCVCG